MPEEMMLFKDTILDSQCGLIADSPEIWNTPPCRGLCLNCAQKQWCSAFPAGNQSPNPNFHESI